MKQLSMWILVLMLTAFIVGCSAGRYPYAATSSLADESWRSQMAVDPSSWAAGADSWFRVSEATMNEYMNETAPLSEAISREAVRIPNVPNIRIQGDFQVQITGDCDDSSVFVEGPNPAVRSVAVVISGNTLVLSQAQNAPTNMSRVVVHVAMKNLNSLYFVGSGRVEGKHLYSSHLTVESNAMGNIFLAGRLNVKCVMARNCGSINIYTVNTTQTEIVSTGQGNINIKAECNAGLKAITHTGTANVSVVNAAGDNVMIDAKGKGRINVIGRIGVRQIRASEQVCVFISNSSSGVPCIYVYDDARVGIAGRAGTLYAYTTRTAKLMSRYLVADTIYAESSGSSHMNIAATNKVFATARDYSTIYFYGDPDIVEAFQRNGGAVITMDDGMTPAGKCTHHRRTKDTLDPAIRMGTNDLDPARNDFRAGYYLA